MGIKCITFDLDDTLWDCESVLTRAERIFYDWLAEEHPTVSSNYAPADLLEHRRSYARERPHLHHDLTNLRKQWLADLADELGYEKDLVEPGFRVFWEARNNVVLFEDAVHTLRHLSTRYCLGTITNGNADVHYIGIGHFFDFVMTSEVAGAAKPQPEIFHAALGEAGVSPNEAVHVGDDPERDIRGASAVGMRTIWVNPRLHSWPGGPEPDAVVQTVGELQTVLASWQGK